MCYILGCFSNRAEQSSGIFTSSGRDPVGMASSSVAKKVKWGHPLCFLNACAPPKGHILLTPGLLEMLTWMRFLTNFQCVYETK